MFVAKNLLTALATVIDYALWPTCGPSSSVRSFPWVSPDPYNPISAPLLRDRAGPVVPAEELPLFAGSIDFSPMVAILAILFLQRFVVRTLLDLAMRMP